MIESEQKKERKPDGPTCDRALLCPEDWIEPKDRKVIGEFHKEGLPGGLPGVDADLERFEEFWSSRGSVNVQSSYHKRGAPYQDEIEGTGDRQPQAEIGDEAIRGAPTEEVLKGTSQQPIKMPEPQSNRTINLATVEIISYALFRTVFGTGLRIPLKKEGMIDAEITVRNKDIIVNTNQFYASIPDLAVWRIIYTHQGSPIFELGRGVPKGMKVYRWNALKLGFGLWRQNRAALKAKEKLMKERENAPVGEKSNVRAVKDERSP
jgi:hypothetical protein